MFILIFYTLLAEYIAFATRPVKHGTGGKFVCACVSPLNDDNVIAGVKMAREI